MVQLKLGGAIADEGGSTDIRLEKHLKVVRELYRKTILGSLLAQFSRPRQLRIDLPSEIRLIFSSNDSFIPVKTLLNLQIDLGIEKVSWFEYGHFPYSAIDAIKIQRCIEVES
jgi:hypothetical protein